MNANTALKRWLAAGLTAVVFVVILIVSRPTNSAEKGKEEKKAGLEKDWPMFGGTLQRNFVNLIDKNIPKTWDVKKKTNILWTADPGDKAYGGPVVAAGKVFVGTNNQNPRDPAIKGDKGVLMCFNEK